MEVIIEKIGPEHLDTLRSVGLMAFAAAFEHQNNKADYDAYVEVAFDPKNLAIELENPASAFFFAKTNGQTAGYLKLNHPPAQQEDFGKNCLEVQRIYSLPAHYGKGVGEALMRHAFEVGNSFRYEFIWLGVWEHNPRAIRFYQKLGFEVFGSHPFLFGNDLQTDFLMRRNL